MHESRPPEEVYAWKDFYCCLFIFVHKKRREIWEITIIEIGFASVYAINDVIHQFITSHKCVPMSTIDISQMCSIFDQINIDSIFNDYHTSSWKLFGKRTSVNVRKVRRRKRSFLGAHFYDYCSYFSAHFLRNAYEFCIQHVEVCFVLSLAISAIENTINISYTYKAIYCNTSHKIQ